MKRVAVVTGAGGGIGQAVSKALRVEYPTHPLKRAQYNVVSDSFPVRNCSILVCCHAASIGVSFLRQLEVDLVGAYNACMAVLPGMVERRFGRIVLLGSIRAHQPRPIGQIAYAAAKAGIEGLARAIASEYGGFGITCNVVAPGAVDTPRTRANIAAGTVSEADLISRTPAGRLATVQDVAAAVLWLCSDSAAMVNGQVITVDGGWSIRG